MYGLRVTLAEAVDGDDAEGDGTKLVAIESGTTGAGNRLWPRCLDEYESFWKRRELIGWGWRIESLARNEGMWSFEASFGELEIDSGGN